MAGFIYLFEDFINSKLLATKHKYKLELSKERTALGNTPVSQTTIASVTHLSIKILIGNILAKATLTSQLSCGAIQL